MSDADDLDENEVDNDEDDDDNLDENFDDDEDSFNEDNSLNESTNSNGMGAKVKKSGSKKVGKKQHMKQNFSLANHHSSSPMSNSLLQINNRFLDNPHHYQGGHHHNHHSSSSKPARIRTVLNEKQLHTLRACYNANPRPDALMKEQLVEMTGLNPRVIRVWFQNKRCKDKKKNMLVRPDHSLQLPTAHHHHHQQQHFGNNTPNNLITSHQHSLMFDNCY